MHRAALDNPGAVRVLIESGAKVNKLNKDQIYDGSVTPLFYAAKYSHRDAITALCAAGAHPRLGIGEVEFVHDLTHLVILAYGARLPVPHHLDLVEVDERLPWAGRRRTRFGGRR